MTSGLAETYISDEKPTIITKEDRIAQVPESFPLDSCLGDVTWKTVISAPGTLTNSLTAGYATIAAGGGYLSPHTHADPEIYYITKGKGLMAIGGVEREVAAGDVIFVPGNVEHGIRTVASGDDAAVDLEWFYVFAVDGFSQVKYVFPT